MKLFQIFRRERSPEVKGYYEDPANRSNEYLKQVYAGVNQALLLPDWNTTAEREALFKLYADKDNANHAVFAVVDKLSDAIADIMQYAELYDKGDNVIADSWGGELLQNPNDAQTMQEFVKLWAVNLLVVGDAFVYGQTKAIKENGLFNSMYVMPSHTVEILSGGLMAPIKGYRIVGKNIYNGTSPALNEKNVMFSKLANPSADTFHGLSPLVSVLKDIEIIENGKKRTNGAIKNGGVGNIISPGATDGMGMTPSDKDKFEKELNKKHSGNYNKVVSVPVTVARLGDTPADLTLLQATEASVQAVCNVYGYPIDLLFGKSTFSNMGEAKKMRYEMAIPYANYFLQKFSKWTGETVLRREWKINTDEIEALKPDATNIIAAMNDAGTTINERREYMGYPALKDDICDKVSYPMSLSFGEDGVDLAKPLPEVQPKPNTDK